MSSAPKRMEPELREPLQGDGAVDKQPSFAKKVKAISVEKSPSKNPLAFLFNVCGICCVGLSKAASCVAYCFLLLLAQFIPITMIMVGTRYYDNEYCPQENIALLLIIGGCIGGLSVLFEWCGYGKKLRQQILDSIAENGGVPSPPKEQPMPIVCILLFSAVRIAALIWLIVAAVVVYRFYGTVSYDQGDEAYCRPILFRSLFWMVIIGIVSRACLFVLQPCFGSQLAA